MKKDELKPGPGYGPIHELLFREELSAAQLTDMALAILDLCDQSDYTGRGVINTTKLRQLMAGRMGIGRGEGDSHE